MESVRDKWTDERLDDLNQRVDAGFGEARDQLRDVRNEMRAEFGDVRKEMRAEFGAVREEIHAIGVRTTERLDSIQRSMMQLAVALTTAMVAGFAGIFALLAAAL